MLTLLGKAHGSQLSVTHNSLSDCLCGWFVCVCAHDRFAPATCCDNHSPPSSRNDRTISRFHNRTLVSSSRSRSSSRRSAAGHLLVARLLASRNHPGLVETAVHHRPSFRRSWPLVLAAQPRIQLASVIIHPLHASRIPPSRLPTRFLCLDCCISTRICSLKHSHNAEHSMTLQAVLLGSTQPLTETVWPLRFRYTAQ